MKSLKLSPKLVFGLLGLCALSIVEIMPAFAAGCGELDAASLEGCKDKDVTASGSRMEMGEVPEHFMMADPSFSGGEELQDYMKIGDASIILHTIDEVDCPGKIKATGMLNQIDIEGKKAWVIKVKGFECQ